MRRYWMTAVVVLSAHVCLAGEPFIFDFSQGLPNEFFKLRNITDQQQVENGVKIVHTTPEGWQAAEINPRFRMQGDFDIEVEFDQLDIKLSGAELEQTGIMFAVHFTDELKQYSRLFRNQTSNEDRILYQISKLEPDGSRSYPTESIPMDCISGRMRMVRKGDTITQMIIHDGIDDYEVREKKANDSPTDAEGIRLRVFGRGNNTTTVVWKSMRITADKLIYEPPQDEVKRRLYVMNVDGTDVREVTKPLSGMSHLGSPEWSSDGQRICFDMSMGQTNTSHIASVKADGSDPQDHGTGCMPSFSPDNEYLVYSSPGIMRTDVAATFRESLDTSGWGVQWSPDGQYIAYGKSGNVVLLNVDTEETRMLLNDEQAKRVGHVYWNLGWSHDSKSIAFKSRNNQTKKYEIVVADIDSEDGFQVLHEDIDPWVDFTFTPDNRKVLFALRPAGSPNPRLVTVSRDDPGKVEEYPNQPEGYAYYGADFSPDGNKIAFAGLKLGVPVVWGE